MLTYLFAKSLVIGLAVAAPLGPIGALCISRTLERGFWAGVAGGVGTAFADAVYAALAALGFAVFAAALAAVSKPLGLAGGLFLIWLGWRTFSPAALAALAPRGLQGGLVRTTATTFLLTLANPMTVLSFAAILAGLGLAGSGDPTAAAVVVAGVFLGLLAWWLLLSGGVALLKRQLSGRFAQAVNRASGLLIMAFGLLAVGSALG